MTHYDQVEQDLYNKAKGAESERKRRDQVLSKMEEDLTYLKRENARRLKVGVKWVWLIFLPCKWYKVVCHIIYSVLRFC